MRHVLDGEPYRAFKQARFGAPNEQVRRLMVGVRSLAQWEAMGADARICHGCCRAGLSGHRARLWGHTVHELLVLALIAPRSEPRRTRTSAIRVETKVPGRLFMGIRTVLLTAFLVAFAGFEVSSQPPSPQDATHDTWVLATAKEMKTITVGMTRADLLKVFTPQGGFYAGN